MAEIEEICVWLCVKVTQLCLNLCDPVDYTVYGILQATGVGSPSLLQRIVPTQGSNPAVPHCRQILYQLGHKGSPQKRHIGTKSHETGWAHPQYHTSELPKWVDTSLSFCCSWTGCLLWVSPLPLPLQIFITILWCKIIIIIISFAYFAEEVTEIWRSKLPKVMYWSPT